MEMDDIMVTSASPAAVAWMVLLAGTFAILAYTYFWAASNRHPVRARAHLTGRAASPYWYTPTGRQDERGIVAVPLRSPRP